ncbi:RdRp [Aedes camptorhynchus negev-like virus]|uniref:RdRp n=1 Tax=Aedes camptorhynchus negev-like virus TaxID=2010268 RepID=UPI000B4F86BC|nr:RdRp [Aedes camptorhynchus negev-like virus]ASA47360.1 RdRp [Aedes camptorhynchus negev-like virus]
MDSSNVLQFFFDTVLPGSSLEFREHDHLRFEYETPMKAEGIMFELSVPTFKKYDRYSSNIRTSIQYPLHNSQKLNAKAFLERNGLVPQCQGEIDNISEANKLLLSFKKLCSHNDFSSKPILPNYSNLEQWISGQPPSVLKILESEEGIYDQRFDVYDFIVKTIPKIDLEIGAEFRYKAPQTIAYQRKIFNSVFCPLLKEFMDRVEIVMDKNILLYNNMSPVEFAQYFTNIFPVCRYRSLSNFFEIDFSKYDKSQGLVILLFEVLVMQEFGVPTIYLKMWVLMHRFTQIIDRSNRFSAYVQYQRKSGDAGTWRLNTVVQIAILNHVFRLYEMVKNDSCLACFSGDDSLIFCKEIVNIDQKLLFLQTRYNLEAKLMNFSVPYFCSKFLILVDNKWIFVPDTVKLIAKLGRNDLVDDEHVECYRISFEDNLYYYKNCNNWTVISYAINDRYKTIGEHDIVYRALLSSVYTKSSFRRLYDKGVGFVKGKVSSKPKLDF